MKRFASALLAALTMLAAPVRAASTPSQSAPTMTGADLDAFFAGLMPYAIHRGNIAGAVIVVVKGDRIIFSKGYGYADLAKRTPVIPDRTIFRPGSVSKTFTWTAVMQQVQAGKIDLDADVNRYLDFTIPPKYGKPITMRNLMTHTPGFGEVVRDLFVEHPSDLYPLGDYLKAHIPDRIFPPGTVIAYSNYGAALAGYIVQRVSGEPFDQYIARHILQPLHMDDSTFVQPLPTNLAPLMAKGYVTASRGKAEPFELVEGAPAGALSATGTDMAHFMIAYLNGGRYDGAAILEPKTIDEMFTLQMAPAPGMNGFGLGFYQENRNGQIIYAHAGDTDVFHSDLHLLPKQHVGIFMSFNSAGDAGAVEDVRTHLFRAFLDRYFPYSPPQEKTVADPQRDAARVAGWYQTSRRADRALLPFYALAQVNVSARGDGTIEVSMLKDLAGAPLRWREVGPLYYRQVDGQAHLKFTADENGRILSWTSDAFIPVFIFQRVDGLTSLGSLKLLFPCFVAVLVLSLLIRLGAWIARRRLGLRLELTRSERWVHLAARIGAIALLAVPVGWLLVLSNEAAILNPSIVGKMIVMYLLGVIAILGGIAIVTETVMRVRRGPGGWLVRSGEIVVALAAVYGIWFISAFGLVNFVTNF
jgi:CubicO group peptidase (beta-lactamase class C family)